jgi:multidrug efflux pump subunit AcrB
MTKLELQALVASATVAVTVAPAVYAKGIKKPKRVTKAHAKRVDAIVSRYIKPAA